MPDPKRKGLRYHLSAGNTLLSFAEGVQTGENISIVRVIWGRIFAFILILALIGWIALGTALFLWLRHGRDYATITYTQAVFPWKWPERRITQGEELIARAKTQLKEQRIRDAFFNLRIGVNLSPRNQEGRLLLAQFFTVMGRQDQAITLMVEGMRGVEDNIDYLRGLFQLLLQFQEDSRVQQIAAQLLPATPDTAPRNQLVALAAATAKFHRGNYDQAEDLINQYELLRTKEGWPLLARIDWERGSREQAIQRLEALTERSPADDSVYVMLGTFYREMGRDTKAESTALLRQLMNPESPAPRIGLMYAYREKGDTVRLNAAIETYLKEFGSDRDALWALADYAANSGNVPLAERVLEYCNLHSLPKDGPTLMSIEAAIVAKQYRRGLELIDNLVRDNPRWSSQFGAVITGLQAIGNFGIGNRDVGDVYLTQFLSQPNIRVESLLAVSNRLLDLGAKDKARRVLDQAIRADSLNQAALSRLISIDLELGLTADLDRNIASLIRMRKPSVDLMERALSTLVSDQFSFLPERERILGNLRTTIAARKETSKQPITVTSTNT